MGKKQTTKAQLDETFEVQEGQVYGRSLGPRGNHQHEVEFTDGSKKLVTLPPRFRNVIWLKRGSYVIVDPNVGIVSEKVGGEIVNVLFVQHIKELKAQGKWPSEFDNEKKEEEEEEQQHHDNGDDSEDNDDDLFVNNNRPVMSDSESSSDEEE